MKQKVIELIEKEIKETERGIEIGSFLNPWNGLKEEAVSEDRKDFAEGVIKYLRDYLIPEIKKIND